MSAVSDMEAQAATISRRGLLRSAAGGAAIAAIAAPATAEAAARRYPRMRVIPVSRLKANRPVSFAYPLEEQPNVVVDLGREVPEGVGPRRSIVAYSLLCQHMGCPVEYRRSTREFVCPCHQTQYDPERLGAIIQGVALRPLPRVLLEVEGGAVWAVGVDGLVYGYRSNLTPGRRAS